MSVVSIKQPINELYLFVTNTMKDGGEVGTEANHERPDEMSVVNTPRPTRKDAIVREPHRKA